MTTTVLAPAGPQPQINLDTRLALRLADMTVRLDEAAVAFEVNTAHLPGADPIPDIAEIVPLTPTLPAANPYSTPLAALLHRARVHIETNGWLRGGLREDHGTRRCPIGAIRIEAATGWEADDACVLLLDAIQADFADAESVPSWNDTRGSAFLACRYLDRAAELAHTRNL